MRINNYFTLAFYLVFLSTFKMILNSLRTKVEKGCYCLGRDIQVDKFPRKREADELVLAML